MKQYIRRGIQISFFILVALISINHTLADSGRALPIIGTGSLHAICPFGTVAGIVQLVRVGTFVKKVHGASLILLYLVLLLAILFGPVFCGWMCPLGSIQEWINKLGRKIGFRQKKVPIKIDRVLRYLRYVVLGVVILKTTQAGELVFTTIDPYYALFNFWTPEFVVSSGVVLIIVLGANLYIERAWCKYFCPLGAFLGISNIFRLFKFRRRRETCTSCQLCTSSCPMNIEVHKRELVKDHQCISCFQCTSEVNCPEDKTVELKVSTKGLGVTLPGMGIIVLLVMVGGISFASLTNSFETESSKVPQTLAGGSGYDPGDIRGSYGFVDVSEAFDIPLDILGMAFVIPEEEWQTIRNKDLEVRYIVEDGIEIGNGSVKMFVSLYTGLPYDYVTAGDYIPVQAFEILDSSEKITEKNKAYLLAHSVKLENKVNDAITSEINTIASVEDDHSQDIKMTGKTTVEELLEWGVSQKTIEEILGNSMPSSSYNIRDYCVENGLTFSEIKNKLQEALNEVNHN